LGVLTIDFNHIVFDNRSCIIFLRLSDATFELINQNTKLLEDKMFLLDSFKEAGPNIHLIKGYGYALGLRLLVKELIKQMPKTISFYREDFKKLHYLYGR